MPEPSPSALTIFRSSRELGLWLEEHHASKAELWIRVFKKHTKKASVTWNEIVLEALCWGWIDGIKKSINEDSYAQRITPRKPRSTWSKRNTEHAERLVKQGRMQKPGLVQVDAAKADGRWQNAYKPPSETEVPEDFVVAVEGIPKARRFYATLKKSSRYAITYGLNTAKRSETRDRRFKKYLDMLTRGEEPGFGFKKT